ncbi:sulfurtransferase complex subunit TusC [Ningiella sp. W23]|uniref:sulfurtransferase complex subunit TusC n=1 Tax=Ningiella sp. W23 TaxID=3023715 RepID=UPI00375830CC
MNAYLLAVSTKAPYHQSAAIDALEAAYAATNVGIQVKILFLDDGVFQLIPDQNPQHIEHKNTFKKLCAMPLFDVEDIFADSQSANARSVELNLKDIPVQELNAEQRIALIHNAAQVLVF